MTRLLAPLISPVRSPLWSPVAGARGRRRGAASAGPVVASYSQSSNYGGAGVEAVSVANMNDSLAEPFAATNAQSGGVPQWVQMTLQASATVASVTIMASTSTGGWGASSLNGRRLERTNDASPGAGSTWTTVQTLSGFSNGSSQTISVGADCTALRISTGAAGDGAFLAVGDFRVA